METFSALLAICAGNSPANGEFAAQRPVTRSFDIFFDLSLNERLSKHNNREAGDLRHHHAHYDVTVMQKKNDTYFSKSGCRVKTGILGSVFTEVLTQCNPGFACRTFFYSYFVTQ